MLSSVIFIPISSPHIPAGAHPSGQHITSLSGAGLSQVMLEFSLTKRDVQLDFVSPPLTPHIRNVCAGFLSAAAAPVPHIPLYTGESTTSALSSPSPVRSALSKPAHNSCNVTTFFVRCIHRHGLNRITPFYILINPSHPRAPKLFFSFHLPCIRGWAAPSSASVILCWPYRLTFSWEYLYAIISI